MRFGLGWRNELGGAIIANLDRIDIVEVLAEEFFDASARERRALRFLGQLVPIVVHATSLGLASTERVDRKRLDEVARVIGWIEPELWSEHLAFVRAGAIEIGHLAAPPRNDAVLHGLATNIDVVRRTVGSAPLLENVASLVEPPLCDYDEPDWLNAVAETTGCRILLDLHNLHANATNFGFDAQAAVRRIASSSIGAIHIAGGKVIDGGRILDDHLHEVPDLVFDLLREVGDIDGTLILERDGDYPDIEILLSQLDRARANVGTRLERHPEPRRRRRTSSSCESVPMTPLAHAYITGKADAIPGIDPEDLALAARSFERKRRSALRRHRHVSATN